MSVAAFAGCTGMPDPVPLRGPAPKTVMVCPVDARGVDPVVAAMMDRAAHLVFSARGYGVVPAAVAGNMLESVGVGEESFTRSPSSESLAELADRFEVDAVLLRTLRPVAGGAASQFRLDWTLLAVDGQTLWSWSEIGGGDAGPADPIAMTRFGNDPLEESEPLLERRLQGQDPAPRPPSVIDQVDAVHERMRLALPPVAR